MKPFAVLILAAGFSRRMGQFKPLLPLGQDNITSHLASTFLSNGVKVYIVIGYRGQEIVAALNTREVTFVENHDYANGMFTSIQAGVRALAPSYEAFFVMPVDIPLVKPETVKSLLNAYSINSGKIIYPVFHQRRGHPPLIPGTLAGTVEHWRSDGNLKELLTFYKGLALEVNVPDENILVDIDTLEDYRSILESPLA